MRKTDTSTNGGDSNSTAEVRKHDDPDKQCPLHNKPHQLRKCRSFRNKMLDERKVFLREKHICFNCCASSTHVAKDCDRPVLCQECKIDKPSAVHLGPTPWKVDAYVSTVDHGGEQQLLQAIPSITSKCTEICGSGNTSNSCSKICLALVCPAGQIDRAMTTYIVLDEESNRFLGGTKFFEHFGIKDAGLRYTIKTFSGVMETREQLHDDIIRRNTHIP